MIFNYKGLNINYNIYGEGKPLLLLHGWMACIESMAPIYQFFAKSRKVIALDFPGQGGKSDTLNYIWGVPEYCEMVYEFINELGIKGCDVIGHSFGGRIIIYLSSHYHDLFDKIILVDSAGVKPKMSLTKFYKIYSYKLVKKLFKIFLPKEKYEETLTKFREKRGSSDYKQLNSEVMRETFKQVINLDLTANLKEILNSTLLMWGENDKDTPLYMAKIMEKEIQDAGLVILKGAGHFSYLDKSSEFLKVADTFLSNRGGR